MAKYFGKAYRKTQVALTGVVILILQTELGAGSKYVTYAIALATAFGVYGWPNGEPK